VVDVNALAEKEKRLHDQLALIAQSPDAIAEQITRAGLDTTLKLVAERRPLRPEQSTFVMILAIAVIGTCTLIGSAILFGSFDTRVHDSDDVARLGLPVLGHVPGFNGDDVGSMEARGARRAGTRARRSSWLRWRSYR
jgi:capsular polysaccharide biosynthesis protein